MNRPASREDIWNVPNALTLTRIFLVPIIVVILLTRSGPILAAAIFLAASLTDLFDGYYARKHGKVTTFGKLLDPIADKLLTSSAFISLVELDRIHSWIVVIIIAREFAVSGLRMIAVEEGVVIAASPWGKAKTVSQIVCIVLLILNQEPWENWVFGWLGWMSLLVALVLTIQSGVDYFVKYFRAEAPEDKGKS